MTAVTRSLNGGLSSHCRKMCEAMHGCVENKEFCDTIIRTTTTPVYAHAIVLANLSKELQLLVTPVTEIEGCGRVKYELDVQPVNCSAEVMSALLKYCYTGELGPIPEDSINDLYITAQYLGINAVGMMCVEYQQNIEENSEAKDIVPTDSDTKTVMLTSYGEFKQDGNHLLTAEEINESDDQELAAIKQEITENDDDIEKEYDDMEEDYGEDENDEDGDTSTTHIDLIKMQSSELVKDEGEFSAAEFTESQSRSSSEEADGEIMQISKKRKTSASPNKPTKCPECPRTFRSAAEMMRHYEPAHLGVKWKCDECDKSFNYKTDLMSHIQCHSGFYKYKCEYCGEGFGRKFNKDRHVRRKHLEKRERAKRMKVPPKHLESSVRKYAKVPPKVKSEEPSSGENQNQKLFRCSKCPKSFVTVYALERHYGPVHEGKRWTCEYCGLEFSLKSSLNCHIQNHTGQYKYQCDICNEGFGRKFDYDRHVARKHKTKTFQCDLCGKRFDYKQLLKNHQVICGVETKDFECDICFARLKSQALLREHKRLHDPTYATQCRFCEKFFKTKKQAGVHERTVHTDSPTVECPICNAVLKSEKSLSVHILKHDESNLVPCQYCEKKFKSKTNLRLHEKNMHPNAGDTLADTDAVDSDIQT